MNEYWLCWTIQEYTAVKAATQMQALGSDLDMGTDTCGRAACICLRRWSFDTQGSCCG